MKLRQIILGTLSSLVILSAQELTAEQVQNAYYSSYELEAQERYAEASQALDPIFESYPNGYTVNYRRGWLAYCDGHYADAKVFCQTALTQYPSSMEVRILMIKIEAARQEWAEVETLARAGRTIDYYNLDLAYWQAAALRIQGNCENAITIVEEITALYPTNTNFMLELAKCSFSIGDYSRAAELASGVIVLDPYNPEAAALMEQLE